MTMYYLQVFNKIISVLFCSATVFALILKDLYGYANLQEIANF